MTRVILEAANFVKGLFQKNGRKDGENINILHIREGELTEVSE